MKMKWLMRIMKYITSLIRTFYLGILAIVLFVLGLLNPVFSQIGLFVLIIWLLYGVIDQIILARVWKQNPELQEIVNSVMAQDGISFDGIAAGQEVTFCKLEDDEISLVGRCLNVEENKWNVRLLYEDSYQMFNWKLCYNKEICPQMYSLKDTEKHEQDILVKCYCREADGKARWQLHLLKRNECVYDDICLDMISFIEQIKNAYTMTYDPAKSLIHLSCDQEQTDFVTQEIFIPNDVEPQPLHMVYGDVVMFDFSQRQVKISVGAKYKELSVGQFGDYYVVGDLCLSEDEITVSGIHIENGV